MLLALLLLLLPPKFKISCHEASGLGSEILAGGGGGVACDEVAGESTALEMSGCSRSRHSPGAAVAMGRGWRSGRWRPSRNALMRDDLPAPAGSG